MPGPPALKHLADIIVGDCRSARADSGTNARATQGRAARNGQSTGNDQDDEKRFHLAGPSSISRPQNARVAPAVPAKPGHSTPLASGRALDY
jgi:hypothetical protein